MSNILKIWRPVPGEIDYTPTWEQRGDFLELVLKASGIMKWQCSGYKFERVYKPIPGLFYSFNAWVGGPLPEPLWHYFEHTQNTGYLVRSIGPRPSSVVIIDGDHPSGKSYPIRYGPNVPQSIVTQRVEASLDDDDETNVVLPPVKIFVAYGGKFTIECPYDKEGVDIVFNHDALEMVSAGITKKTGDVFWTFRAISMLPSTIVANLYGMHIQSSHRTWEITVLDWPYPFPPKDGDIMALSPPQAAKDGPGIPENFLSSVNMAVGLVKEKYKDVKLREVIMERRPFTFKPVKSPWDLLWLTAYFDVAGGRVSIKSRGTHYSWEPPVFEKNRSYGGPEVKWPLEGKLWFEKAFFDILAAATKKSGDGSWGVLRGRLFHNDIPQMPPEFQNQPVYELYLKNDKGENAFWWMGSVTKKPAEIPMVYIVDLPVNANDASAVAPGEISPAADSGAVDSSAANSGAVSAQPPVVGVAA